MAEHDEVRDPGEELADEGMPQLEGQRPGKVFTGDTHDALVPPRDYPLGADDWGVTAAEERQGESLADRVTREEPDVTRADAHAGRLVQPDDGVIDADEEKQVLGGTAGYDDGGWSAEEQAVQVRDDPPGLT